MPKYCAITSVNWNEYDLATAAIVDFLHTMFEEALVKWVVDTSKFFHTVEHNAFKYIFSLTNRHFNVLSQRTNQHQVLKRIYSLQIVLHEVILCHGMEVNLTAVARSSSIYRGYLVITTQCIDIKWNEGIYPWFSSLPKDAHRKATALFLYEKIWKVTTRVKENVPE